MEARHLLASRPQDRHEPDFSGDDLLLWQALRRLPARQRAAIVLRYYLDLPEAEVARQLGVPVGTVKSLDVEFAVNEWCNRDLTGATLRVTAEDGRRIEQPLPGARPAPTRRQDCRDRGRPAAVAGLP